MAKVLALMNVKYVLVHNDAAWSYLSDNNWYVSPIREQIPVILDGQRGFSFERSFGEIDFYRNDYWQPMRVYPASTGILSNGNLNQLIETVERSDFNLNDSIIMLSSQIDAQQISNLPISTELVQSSDLNSSYYPISTFTSEGRLVYTLSYKPVASAQYYSGWKKVISTNGQGDPGMIVFSSPIKCPYIRAFPHSFTNWSSYDSTLIYITSPLPLTINSITADGTSVIASAWWQDNTSWITGWPITIPPNQNTVIQVAAKASTVTLQTNNGPITLSVTDGWTTPFTIEKPSEITVFVPNATDYVLAIKTANIIGYGNLSVKIDDQTFGLDSNSQNQGIGSVYKYVGPIRMTPGLHTISSYDGDEPFEQIGDMLFYSLSNGESFVNADNLLFF